MKAKMPVKNRAPAQARLLELLDDSYSLLRDLPVAAWTWLLCGSVPFVLLLLYFWTDMSRAPDAARRLVDGALWLALAYAFMKVCHAWFGEHMLSRLRGEARVRGLSANAWARLVASQVVVHSLMPAALILSSLAALPFAWVFAFFHNASILAVGHFREGGTCRALVSKAVEAARFAPRQNHAMIAVCGVAAFLAWLNLLLLAFLLPSLVKVFSGVDNPVSDSPLSVLNTTTLAAVTAVTWLGITPFFRAAYAVRCFRTLSRSNGEDLGVALRRWRVPARGVAGVAALVVAMGLAVPGAARAEGGDAGGAARIDAVELEESIRDVMASPVFQWRLPREATPESEMGWLERTMMDFHQWLSGVARTTGRWLGDLIDRLLFRPNRAGGSGRPGDAGLAEVARPIFVILAVVILVVGVVWLLRAWMRQRRQPKPAKISATAIPDLEDENLIASDLAEDEWLALARERFAAGDTRQALRALFLGTLAGLGERGLLAIARGKTNGMYARELSRRASHLDDVREAFTENVRAFDGAWYGTHEVDGVAWRRFQENHSTISRHVRPV